MGLRSELGLADSGTPELTVLEGGAAGSDSAADDADGKEPTGGDAAEPVAEEAKASPAEQAVAE